MGWDVLIFPNLCSLMYFACIIEEIKCKYCSFSLTVGREKKNGKKKKRIKYCPANLTGPGRFKIASPPMQL